ncbi:MAG: response regulator transcription factor [Saprospiraceae bacterium]
MPNVVCVDDHSLILEGLKSLLEQIEDFHWRGEYTHPMQLSKALQEDHSIDIVLIDVFYQRENKLEDIAALAQKFDKVKWIILSAYESPALVQQAFSYGISGYLRKDVTIQELRHALQLVWAGKKNINYTGINTGNISTDLKEKEPLSSREKDIVGLIIKGQTEQRIAESLFISKHTVHTHRKNIFKKLELHSNAELIRYFIENPLS